MEYVNEMWVILVIAVRTLRTPRKVTGPLRNIHDYICLHGYKQRVSYEA